MNELDLHRRPYQRPPLARGVDPQRMNWLWRLISEVAELKPAQVVDALHASQVPVNLSRVNAWMANDQAEDFFPLSIAELERNLRAVLALRQARLQARESSAADEAALADSSGASAGGNASSP